MKKSNIVSSILQQSKTFIHVWKYRKSNTKPRSNPSNKLDRMMRVSKIPPTTDSFFTRRVDPSQKSLSFVSQSVLHAEKVPFATVSFSLYFNESPGDPLLRIYTRKVSYYFLPARKSAGSRGRQFSMQVLCAPRCPLQIRLFLARPFDSIFQFLHALAKTRTPIVSLPTDFKNFEKSKHWDGIFNRIIEI